MSADKMILGEDAVYSMDSNETGVNNNVIVCAGSGCGKTMSVTEPRLLEAHHSSMVVTVTKRRIVEKYKPMLLKRGYVVKEMNFVNPEKSDIAYDPLAYIFSYSDIRFLAESIVKANPQKENSHADPYWDDTAISLLSAEIAYVLMKKDNPTFADVLDMNSRLGLREEGSHLETAYDEEFKRISRRDPNCYAAVCWESFRSAPYKTASCIYSTLNTTIDTVFSPELRSMIRNVEKINFEEIASRKTVTFITSSAVNPSLNCFINMFYGQMFKQLFEYAEAQPSGKLPIPMSVICDDFATGSPILNFPEYISIFREKQISVTLLVQSESQLVSMYGYDDKTTIINNCDTYVYMGGMDLETCRNISTKMDMLLSDVLYMPVGQVLILRRGQRPVVTERYHILNDVRYQEITDNYEKQVAEQEHRYTAEKGVIA